MDTKRKDFYIELQGDEVLIGLEENADVKAAFSIDEFAETWHELTDRYPNFKVHMDEKQMRELEERVGFKLNTRIVIGVQ